MHNSNVLTRPFLDLASNTDRAASNTEKKARKVERTKARLAYLVLSTTILDLYRLPGDVDNAIREMNSPAADKWSEEDIKEVSHLLAQSIGRIVEILKSFARFGIANSWPYSQLLERISSRNDHLSSIVEGLYMSLSPDFGECMKLSERELRDAAAGSERRSPVEQLR